MTARMINKQGLSLIKAFEGLRTTAWQDAQRRWLVGYNHSLGVKDGIVVDEEDAERLLLFDLRPTEILVDGLVRQATTDNQFAAMVSLAFNIGADAFRASTVLAQHNAYRTTTAADAFMLFCLNRSKDGRRQLDAMRRRRSAERALYLCASHNLVASGTDLEVENL